MPFETNADTGDTAKSVARLRFQKIWLIFGGIQVIAIIYLSLTPHPPQVAEFNYSDKVGHFLAYGLVMFWFCQIYLRIKARILTGIIFITMGITLEFLQDAGGIRVMETGDMLANSIGVFMGAILLLLFPRFNLLRIIEGLILSKTH